MIGVDPFDAIAAFGHRPITAKAFSGHETSLCFGQYFQMSIGRITSQKTFYFDTASERPLNNGDIVNVVSIDGHAIFHSLTRVRHSNNLKKLQQKPLEKQFFFQFAS